MTLKTGVIAAENSALHQPCITGINYIFKYIKIEKNYLNCNTIS